MFVNVLRNPSLSGFTTVAEFVDSTGNKGYRENPHDWEYVWTPQHHEDHNRIAQSLHRDQGFVLAAGWREWLGGYVQRGVALRAGQRYLLKAQFTPHVGFVGDPPADFRNHIQWQFAVRVNGVETTSAWSTTAHAGYGNPEEHLFVIEAVSDALAEIEFRAKSIFASNSCDFNVRYLSMEEVPADYGSALRVGFGDAAAREPLSKTAPAVSTLVENAAPQYAASIALGLREFANSGTMTPAAKIAFEQLAALFDPKG